MMKVVLKVEISDSNTQKKVMKAVSRLSGIVSMAADTKENKITVIGTADPVKIVGKVRKVWSSAYIISAGEEKKKEEPAKKNEASTPKIEQIDWANSLIRYPTYQPTTHYYYPVHEQQYNPNTCVIS